MGDSWTYIYIYIDIYIELRFVGLNIDKEME